MAIHDIRRRSGYLFVAVLLAQVVLISAQVSSRSGVPVLESVVFGMFAEVQRGVWARTWAHIYASRTARA